MVSQQTDPVSSRVAWERVMAPEIRPKQYEKTSVLILGWEENVDDELTAQELIPLQQVFEDTYGFHVQYRRMHMKVHPQLQATKHVNDFSLNSDHPRGLLIIYYAGHGWADPNSVGRISLSGRYPDDDAERDWSIEWTDVELTLCKTMSDVLVIFDCCHAGLLCRPARRGRRGSFYYVAACEADQLTHSSGEKSFTRAMVWALKKLAGAPAFTVTKLMNTVMQHKPFPRNQQEVKVYPSRFGPSSEIWIAPELKKPAQEASSRVYASPRVSTPEDVAPYASRSEPVASTKEVPHELEDSAANVWHGSKTADDPNALPPGGLSSTDDGHSSLMYSERMPAVFKSSTGPSLGQNLTSTTSISEQVDRTKEDKPNEEDDRWTTVTGTDISALDLPNGSASLIASKIAIEIVDSTESSLRKPTDGGHGLIEVPEELLKVFSIMLRREARTPIEIETSVFVRQQRKLIIRITEAQQAAEEEKTAFVVPEESLNVDVNSWMEAHGGELAPPPENPDLDDVTTTLSQDPDTEFDDLGSHFITARTFLKQSAAWAWLIHRLSSSSFRTNWKCIATDQIMNAVTRGLASSSKKVYFRVAWHPLRYMEEQFGKEPWPEIASTVVVTSDCGITQTTTCGQYALQTWSTLGKEILVCLQAAINEQFIRSTEYQLTDLHIKLYILKGHLFVEASGQTGHLVSLGEQLAWLGAACCSSSSPDDMQYREPCFAIFPETTGLLDITYLNHALKPKEGESCWRSLFRNSCVASGFPVRTRRYLEPGLEIDPEMMITLGETDWITTFNKVFMLKGFSSVFVPTQHEADHSTIYWHFIHTDDGSHLPFASAAKSCLGEEMFAGGDLQWMLGLRHFVGWAPHVHVRAGASDYPYHLIRPPTSHKASSGVVAEKLGIGFSHHVTLNATIARGNKDKPLWLSRTQHYDREVVYAREQHVVLFDTLERRAWLVDGASALLHLTCAQLRTDRNHLWDQEAAANFRYADCSGDRSASDALRDEHNRELVLRRDVKSWEEPELGPDNTIIAALKSETTFFRVDDLVLENWMALTKLFERQREPCQGFDMRNPFKKRLFGWSFTELIAQAPIMTLQACKLPSKGTGWNELITPIDACILMCSGLGDIIQPTPATPSCQEWASMPTYQNLLAVTVGELQRIHDKHGQPGMSPEDIIPGLQWKQPHKLFEKCDCAPDGDDRASTGCIRVRQLSRRSRWESFACHGEISSWRKISADSAAIFGIYKPDQSRSKGAKQLQIASQTGPFDTATQSLFETSSLSTSTSPGQKITSLSPTRTSAASDDSSSIGSLFDASSADPSLPTTVSNLDHQSTRHQAISSPTQDTNRSIEASGQPKEPFSDATVSETSPTLDADRLSFQEDNEALTDEEQAEPTSSPTQEHPSRDGSLPTAYIMDIRLHFSERQLPENIGDTARVFKNLLETREDLHFHRVTLVDQMSLVDWAARHWLDFVRQRKESRSVPTDQPSALVPTFDHCLLQLPRLQGSDIASRFDGLMVAAASPASTTHLGGNDSMDNESTVATTQVEHHPNVAISLINKSIAFFGVLGGATFT